MAVFAEKYGAKYAKAVECLTKDRETLLAFFDFPAEHWDHLPTSNPIGSVFATVRHRTVRTKGALSSGGQGAAEAGQGMADEVLRLPHEPRRACHQQHLRARSAPPSCSARNAFKLLTQVG